MRDLFDDFVLQTGYYIDEVRIRVGLDRDDPAVDERRRTMIVIVVCIGVATLGAWWYITHVMVAPAAEQPQVLIDPAAAPTEPAPDTAQLPFADSAAVPTEDITSAEPAVAATCDVNYSPCVPSVSGDLNCVDVGKTVRVIGVDRYRLDNDADGYGCDSYNN